MKSIIKRDKNLFRLIIVLIIVLIGVSMLKPGMFLKINNFQSMAKQFPEFGLLAMGIGLTLITGGIDLSAVSIANLSGIISASVMIIIIPNGTESSLTPLLLIVCILIAIIVGALAGIVNGLLISKLGIPPILTTLGTQQLFAGLAIVYTRGNTISGLPIQFSEMINSTVLGIPMIFLIFLVFAILVGIILSKTSIGKKIYLLGTNSKATEYAGLSNVKIFVFTYMWSGILASIAGIIMMGRFNSAKADYGASYTLQCVLIAVLGGVSPNGGKGNIQGICVAVLILQILSSGLNMFEGISNFYRDLIWGLLLILVLLLNYALEKRTKNKV